MYKQWQEEEVHRRQREDNKQYRIELQFLFQSLHVFDLEYRREFPIRRNTDQ